MFYHETAFLGTMLGIPLCFPYVSLMFGLFINKEITTHYPSITLLLSVQEAISSVFQVCRRRAPQNVAFDCVASTPSRRVTSLSLSNTFSLQK